MLHLLRKCYRWTNCSVTVKINISADFTIRVTVVTDKNPFIIYLKKSTLYAYIFIYI
jgi:hypothetical protein